MSWPSVTITFVVVGGLYLLKGFFVARLIGGRYPWNAAVVDVVAVACLILILRYFDLGLKFATHRLFHASSSTPRLLFAQTTRFTLLGIFAFPLLLALVQFFPQRVACNANPADAGMPYQDVTIDSTAGKLSAWYVPAPRGEGPIVLVTHGLGANKQNFLPAVQAAHALGFSSLIFDFRAHGDSDGRVTTFGYHEADDVEAACQWIRANHPDRPIYALAFSMGAAAVLKAAAKSDPFEKLVIDSTFARVENVARSSLLASFGILQTPAWQLARFWGWLFTGVDMADHRPEENIAKIAHRPILLVHGLEDSMIRPIESERLAKAAGETPQVWFVPGAMHVGSLGHPEYLQRLAAFLNGDSMLASRWRF
ncbi:MAG: alpha/beta fold hydrolase [Planctomycetota bacterium]